MNEDEVLQKLNMLLEGQRELQIMMIGMATRLPDKLPSTARAPVSTPVESPLKKEINTEAAPVWLDRNGVMNYKYWSRTTFFRRQEENTNIWVKEKKNGKWHYLKSSL